MRYFVAVLLSLPISASAQTLPPAPRPAPSVVVLAPVTDLQAAIDAASPGTTIRLRAGITYRSAIVPKTKPGLTITTENCPLGTRTAVPADLPTLATIAGAPGQSYGLWVLANTTTVRCLSFGPNSNGNGDMIRVGDSTSAVLADTPDGVTVAQNYLHGDPGTAFGQKRGVAANGSHLLIEHNYIENIWVPQQDSQCVAIFSTPGWVTMRENICAAASENFIVGGVPPAGPAFLPAHILIEHNVFWKPLAWKGTTDHQVKNLGEVKDGHDIIIRSNWFENHWLQAQPGPSIVLTMATNGACGYCDMQDVTFENNVVWNVSAGLSLTGYQYTYAPGAGQAVRFTIRNNFFVISKATMGGNGRPLIVSNEPKNVVVDHNTFLHDGNAVVAADYGTKWPLQDPPLTGSIKAGPLQGFVFTNNAALHGSYGVFTPEGTNGLLLGTYFPGAVIGGNVWGGAPSTVVTRYDAFAGSAGPNSGPTAAAFSEVYNADMCQSGGTPTGKGADCSKLPWELRALVPR